MRASSCTYKNLHCLRSDCLLSRNCQYCTSAKLIIRCGVTAHAVGLSSKPYLLLAAGETCTKGVSCYTATLASDKARALLAMQTPVPGLLANVVHQTTKVLQHFTSLYAQAMQVHKKTGV